MKSFALLVITVLAPALFQVGASDLPAGLERSEHLYGNSDLNVPRSFNGYSDFDYGAPSRTPTEDSASTRRDGRLWVPAPPLPSEDREPGFYDADPYQPERSEHGVPGLYEQFRPRSSYSGSNWAGRESIPGSGTRHEGVVRQDHYRFRGDDESSQDSGDGVIWRGGYRFRPLTAQERERGGARPGWRPIEDARNLQQQAPRLPTAGKDESYGYQADDWFGRHFGRGSR